MWISIVHVQANNKLSFKVCMQFLWYNNKILYGLKDIFIYWPLL